VALHHQAPPLLKEKTYGNAKEFGLVFKFNSSKKENDTQKTESNEPRTIFTKASIPNFQR
jgi:hypothetical protein